MTALGGWQNFYVIVGSSAGALIGLQFVVMTLIAGRPVAQNNAQAGHLFTTPTIIHFGAVLFLAAVGSAPWNNAKTAAGLWGLEGLLGVAYVVLIVRRLWLQTYYQAVFEDWLFHALLPFASYALLGVSAAVAYSHTRAALFLVGAIALLLLFIGIHNAWDIVTYHVFVKRQEQPETGPPTQK